MEGAICDHASMAFKNNEAQRAYKKIWYQKNKERHIAGVRKTNEKYRQWVRGLKEGKACIDCGEPDTRCLDWHHADPATKEFGLAQGGYRGKQAVLQEIAKCIILCANCHRKRHAL